MWQEMSSGERYDNGDTRGETDVCYLCLISIFLLSSGHSPTLSLHSYIW